MGDNATHSDGVAIMLSNEAQKTVLGWEPVSQGSLWPNSRPHISASSLTSSSAMPPQMKLRRRQNKISTKS